MDDLMLKNQMAVEEYQADRRGFLKHGLLFSAALGFWTPSLAVAGTPPLRVILRSLMFTPMKPSKASIGIRASISRIRSRKSNP